MEPLLSKPQSPSFSPEHKIFSSRSAQLTTHYLRQKRIQKALSNTTSTIQSSAIHLNTMLRQTIIRASRRSKALRSILKSHQENNREPSHDTLFMTTYSASDPRMSRPLSVATPPSISQSRDKWSTPVLKSGLATGVQGVNMADLFPAAANYETVAPETPPSEAVTKPWPYSLSAFLRPRDGTTYALKFGGNAEVGSSPKRIGVLQAILYGVPDPDGTKSGRVGFQKGGVLHQVFYGVKEENKVVVGDAKIVELENEVLDAMIVELENEVLDAMTAEEKKVVKIDVEAKSHGDFELIAK
jgi:hypothetical protein